MKINKNQRNDVIENEPKFDNTFNLSRGTKDPLLVVNFILWEGNKQRSSTVTGLTCLWGSGATNSMIKIKHTKYYERNMVSNKLEYSTSAGLYCMMHDIKVPFCMPKLSSSNITEHRSHVNNYKSESGIGYDMIKGCDLMVKLGLSAEFKCKFFQCNGAMVPMK